MSALWNILSFSQWIYTLIHAEKQTWLFLIDMLKKMKHLILKSQKKFDSGNPTDPK